MCHLAKDVLLPFFSDKLLLLRVTAKCFKLYGLRRHEVFDLPKILIDVDRDVKFKMLS